MHNGYQRHSVAVLIAVKRLAGAKSRLSGLLTPEQRRKLTLAMLGDTVRAASCTPEVGVVAVVTPDPAVARVARSLGVRTIYDPTPERHPNSLNAALVTAEQRVRPDWTNIAVLQGDLPALRSTELSAAIATARAHQRSLVADRHGTGTTALFGFDVPLHPVFGTESAQRHRDSGAIDLRGDWPGLKCDVDTPEDIAAVRQLDPGPATAHAIGTPGRNDRRVELRH